VPLLFCPCLDAELVEIPGLYILTVLKEELWFFNVYILSHMSVCIAFCLLSARIENDNIYLYTAFLLAVLPDF
jgi:hypothetical protein